MEKEIRLLKANEIEVRVSTISENGVSLLLYKDARAADMKILDESFGIFGWQRVHRMLGDLLFCSILLWDEDKACWVEKMDVGSAGFTEKEKSLSSDSFKRAATVVGIGRELYTAPFIWIPASKAEISRRGGKLYCNTRFSVKEVSYNSEREIIGLSIVDEKGDVVFEFSKNEVKTKKTRKTKITNAEKKKLDEELRRTGVTLDEVRERYEVGETTSDVSPEIYNNLMTALYRTKSA